MADYNLKNRESILTKKREHWKMNKERLNNSQKSHYQRNSPIWRQNCFDGYGGKCVCCAESNYAFLTIDHVNQNGAEERKKNQSAGGVLLYKKLVELGFPAGYQLMCFNCNCARSLRSNGICPHELQRIHQEKVLLQEVI